MFFFGSFLKPFVVDGRLAILRLVDFRSALRIGLLFRVWGIGFRVFVFFSAEGLMVSGFRQKQPPPLDFEPRAANLKQVQNLWSVQFASGSILERNKLGRPLGYFIFSLIGLKRTLFTNIFQRL